LAELCISISNVISLFNLYCNALDLNSPQHYFIMESDSFVAFLRMEADLSEEKARRLRAQADALATQHGITVDMESSYGEY
jgi:hypothetical protein